MTGEREYAGENRRVQESKYEMFYMVVLRPNHVQSGNLVVGEITINPFCSPLLGSLQISERKREGKRVRKRYGRHFYNVTLKSNCYLLRVRLCSPVGNNDEGMCSFVQHLFNAS